MQPSHFNYYFLWCSRNDYSPRWRYDARCNWYGKWYGGMVML